MENNILVELADNYLFNEMLKGNKPSCAIYSEELAKFATKLDLDVRSVISGQYSFYTISSKRAVKEYFQLEDILGIINTTNAKNLYNRIKNQNPSRAFLLLHYEIQKRGETLEIALLFGMLCGYALCDIVEYLEILMGKKQNKQSQNYEKRSEADYRIQHLLCSYCRKQYMKYGI